MAVESAVKSLPGISSVEVDLARQEAKVVYETSKINLDRIRESIQNAGYEPV
ncbi:MAG: heavy-metal-associated domain-containing protein [Methylocystaceae bacterium]